MGSTRSKGTVYLAGPMRGYEHFNFPAFDEAAKVLREQHRYEVISPAERDRESGFDETQNSLEGFDLAEALVWDLTAIAQRCDGIVLLPGWEDSAGARAEKATAEALGKSVKYYSSGLLFVNNPEDSKPESGETRITNALTGGEKGTKIARFDLIPAEPLWQLAEHYGKGATKYADRNWERGYEWSLSFAALMRHAWAFWNGEDIDPETGSHHMAAVAFHAFAMMEWATTHPEFDNRPTTLAKGDPKNLPKFPHAPPPPGQDMDEIRRERLPMRHDDVPALLSQRDLHRVDV